MEKIRRILVPTDFSLAAGTAYRFAGHLRTRTDADLIVLHVIAPVYYVERLDLTLLVREARKAAEHNVATLKPAPTRTLIKEGIPHHTVIQTASALDIDLIVMGTHGRSGLERLVLGSVAENVLRHAPCPVLTVRRSSRPAANASGA